MNINTKEYWDKRFATGDWETKQGSDQTRRFAKAFCKHTRIKLQGGQTILDSSCALGDALPVFAKYFSGVQLYACDFSTVAIQRAKTRFPTDFATFFEASIEKISGEYDVVYSSATLEHFDDYKEKARALLRHCRYLCILVPYNEKRYGNDLECYQDSEHVATFREQSLDFLLDEGCAYKILHSIFSVPKAWSWTKKDWIIQPLKNIVRLLLRRPLVWNRQMILFEIEKAE